MTRPAPDGIRQGVNMTPSQTAKHHGCKSLAEVARVTKQSEQTLFNWYKSKPELFKVVCIGAGQLAKQKQLG
jgi:hypothetical protein